MRIFAYLRASTNKQDAERARQALKELVASYNREISHYYIENMSGTKLDRPELSRLIDNSEIDENGRGDILLIESMDRLTRLNNNDWDILNGRLKANGIKLVVLTLPTTHRRLDAKYQDDPSLNLIDTLLFEVWASGAREDYEKRRYRQRQGIDNLKAQNPAEYARKYKGKQPNTKNYEKILKLLDNGLGYKDIKESLGVSGTTIANAKRWRNQQIIDKDKDMIPMFTESDLDQPTKVVKRGRKPFL